MEDHEARAALWHCEAYRGVAIGIGSLRRNSLARYGVPNLYIARGLELNLARETLALLWGDKIPVSAISLSVQPAHIVAAHICWDAQLCDSLLDSYARKDSALANLAQLARLGLAPDGTHRLVEALLRTLAVGECRKTLWRIGHHDSALLHHLAEALQSLWQHSLVLGNPDETIAQTLGAHHTSILHTQAVKKYVGVAVVELVTRREWELLAWLVADFIAQVPQHIAHRVTPLEHITASCEVCCQRVHMSPPGLPAQEWRADSCAKRGAWLQVVNLRIVGVGVEYIVCHALHSVVVCHLFEHLPMLIPIKVKRGERLGIHTGLAVEMCRRCRRLYGLEVQVAHIAVAERMPKLAHRYIGILKILHNVGGEYIARSSLIHHRKAVLSAQLRHTLVETV